MSAPICGRLPSPRMDSRGWLSLHKRGLTPIYEQIVSFLLRQVSRLCWPPRSSFVNLVAVPEVVKTCKNLT
jgi:hypothetical protein